MAEHRKENFSIQFFQIVDAILIFLGFWLAIIVWNNAGVDIALALKLNPSVAEFVGGGAASSLLYAICPMTPILLEIFGFYRRSGRQRVSRALWRLILASVTIFLLIGIASLVFKFTPHRPTLLMGLGFSALAIMARELAFRFYTTKFRTELSRRTWILLAGKRENVESWWEGLPDDLKQIYHKTGTFYIDEENDQTITKTLEETSAERVIFLAEGCSFGVVARAMEECEIMGVEVWLAADFVRARICQPTFDSFGGTSMLVLRSTPGLSWSLILKDMMDKLGAAVLVVLTSPLWLLAYIGIKIQSPGPVFYKQERAGKYGAPFYIWKFRTMIVDADKKLAELKAKVGNEMSGPVFKLEDDPRIFSFGKFMRKFSIDELPQLINVLKGEMSLVGPRPMATYELPEIEKSEHRRKLSVKPGITCIWQVEGRNTITDFDEWVQLDLKYIDNWSLWLDVKILLKTVPAVLFSKGAS